MSRARSRLPTRSPYTARMRSVADSLRSSTLAGDAARHPAERLEVALRLGDADVSLLAASRAITEAQARRDIARQRQHGRLRSACHEQILA